MRYAAIASIAMGTMPMRSSLQSTPLLSFSYWNSLSSSASIPFFSRISWWGICGVSVKACASLTMRKRASQQLLCRASRRMIIHDEDEGEEHWACQKMEAYTELTRSEALLVHALLHDQLDQVIIYKGFSSSLVRRTSSDLSEAVLPSSAIIKSIDRIKGPFDPFNIEYIQKNMSWEEFQELLKTKNL